MPEPCGSQGVGTEGLGPWAALICSSRCSEREKGALLGATLLCQMLNESEASGGGRVFVPGLLRADNHGETDRQRSRQRQVAAESDSWVADESAKLVGGGGGGAARWQGTVPGIVASQSKSSAGRTSQVPSSLGGRGALKPRSLLTKDTPGSGVQWTGKGGAR